MTGRDGRRIDDAWNDGPLAYLGITTAGFPNLFMLYGPNTNNGSILTMIEAQVDHILAHLRRLANDSITWIDVKPEAMQRYNDDVQNAIAGISVWQAGCPNYYRSPSGRIVTQWPFSMTEYQHRTATLDPDAFEVGTGSQLVSAATVFDPLAPGYADSPYEQYERLRDDDPVHRSELLQGWVVTRFDDVGRLLRDPTASSDIHNATPTPLTVMELEQLSEQPRAARTVVLMDDPDHARVRALMAEPFRPREIEKLRARVTDRVDDAFDRLREKYGSGRIEFDLVGEFAYPLPVEIFSEMLGMPEEDNPRFRYWTQCVARAVDPVMSATEREECLRGLDEMYAYLEQQAEHKRAAPADDLMSALVHAEIDGERLSQEDLIAQLVTLYMAGHEPTASLVAAGTLALLRAPDQMARLQADRSLLRNAISRAPALRRPESLRAPHHDPPDRPERHRAARGRGRLRQPRVGQP